MSEHLKIRMNSDDDDLPERPDNSEDKTPLSAETPQPPDSEQEASSQPPHHESGQPMFPDSEDESSPQPPPIPVAPSDPQVHLHVAQREKDLVGQTEAPEPPVESGGSEQKVKRKKFWPALIAFILLLLVLGGFAWRLSSEEPATEVVPPPVDLGQPEKPTMQALSAQTPPPEIDDREVQGQDQEEAVVSDAVMEESASPDTDTPQQEEPAPPPVPREEVKDPLGFYTVDLMSGFTVHDKSEKKRSKRIFDYGKSLNVTIIASPMNREWDPQKELQKKLNAISSGKSPLPPNVKVSESGLTEIGGARGYEIQFAGTHGGEETEMQAYAAVKEGTSISISIVSMEDRLQDYNRVRAGIVETLKIVPQARLKAAPSASKKTKTAKKKWEPTEEDWRQAEAAVDFVGVMKRGDALVALIGRDVVKQGDPISVEYKGHGYTFTVDEISDYELKLMPVKEETEDETE